VRSRLQSPASFSFLKPHPTVHRAPSYTEDPNCLGLRKPVLNGLYHSSTKVFLGFSRQRPSILFSSCLGNSRLFPICHLYYAPISMYLNDTNTEWSAADWSVT
jgi:hypothetical protein